MEQFSGDTEPWGVIGHSSTSTGHHVNAAISVSSKELKSFLLAEKSPGLTLIHLIP